MYKYAFTGVVHPERADVTISNASAVFGDKGKLGKFSFSVFRSKIAGVLSTEQRIQYRTLKWQHFSWSDQCEELQIRYVLLMGADMM